MREIGEIDAAIVLGSGLSNALDEHARFDRIPYADLGLPETRVQGHAGHALVGRWHGKRVLIFAGRFHGYQGFSAREIVRPVEIAADCGAKALLLTNAAGGLRPALRAGDLLVLRDYINLSGLNPLAASGSANPFVNMTEPYSPRLRAIACAIDPTLAEGVYACLLGPTYETAAEAQYLRTIGADAAGMSTVPETIAARARRLETFAVSLITNAVAAPETSHEEVRDVSAQAAPRIAALIDGIIERL